MEAAFEKTLGPIAGSPASGKSVEEMINLFVDDIYGTGGHEKEQGVPTRNRKDFQFGSEDLEWCGFCRTQNSLDTRFTKRAVHMKVVTKNS